MYDEDFTNVYVEYDWTGFSIKLFTDLLKYFQKNNITIKNHLDIACGVGSLCNLFYQKNIKTEGFDLSPHMISVARQNHPQIRFRIQDMVTFNLNKQYDLITCACDSINHLNNLNDVRKVLENIYNHLELNGLFVFDIVDTKNIIFNQKTTVEKGNNKQLVCYYTSDHKYITANVKAFKNEDLSNESNIKILIIDRIVLINMLTDVGFKVLVCSNNINSPNQIHIDNLYFICRKEETR